MTLDDARAAAQEPAPGRQGLREVAMERPSERVEEDTQRGPAFLPEDLPR